MRLIFTYSLSICVFLTLILNDLCAQTNIKYGPDYIVFEAEDTPSPLDKWKLRTPSDPKYYSGTDLEALNQTYIDFRGAWASKESPLTYTFTCPKTGNYRLVMRMYQPLQASEKGDQRNDVFIKMSGNYTSQTNTTKTELEKEHKFWGRGVRKWGSCHKLEIGGKHMNAVYGFTEGEQYTLTMSGRSPWTSIDYILLFDVSLNLNVVNHTDIAAELPVQYRPNLTTSIGQKWLEEKVFSIYPNPTEDIVSLTLDEQKGNAMVSIYSLTGKKVYEHKHVYSKVAIDLSDLNSGMYLVQVKQQGRIAIQKLVIQ